MQGALGIGANLNKWSPAEFDLAAEMVRYYKSIRATVQEGDLYRLDLPRQGNLTANEYVSSDGTQAVVFAFLHSQQFLWPAPTVYLRGLDESADYQIRTIDDKLVESQRRVSGSFLMHHGLNFALKGDYDSTSVALERIAASSNVGP